MTIEIYQAQIEDTKKIANINTMAYNDETNRFGLGRNGCSNGHNIANIMQSLISQKESYKILLDNVLIGWFWLERIDDEIYKLNDFCIAPSTIIKV
ncbi:hypothetical protein FACS1894105_08430 [Clostridia bacterium]|nr:hypothetical protein FACS1894105_08430 [Clostridia bacterium]